MTVGEALEGVSSILLDSAPFIYHVERHPTYAPLLQAFFHARAALLQPFATKVLVPQAQDPSPALRDQPARQFTGADTMVGDHPVGCTHGLLVTVGNEG